MLNNICASSSPAILIFFVQNINFILSESALYFGLGVPSVYVDSSPSCFMFSCISGGLWSLMISVVFYTKA
jgi:hypothetical protein